MRLCFNPRAREGRDLRPSDREARGICFNPRAREGRDVVAPDRSANLGVSIHAPVKGATGLAAAGDRDDGFNPRAREGRDRRSGRRR